ncbi:carbohydrate porin [Janthinobacterium fluminis]|uniref:Carbohydrate porin n=1 Tax=Janthinobacterium fluminis TaxID=2987524 RepID=A0ABT5JV91_9BURK|nr:carbohydrate porin [Janthinobacterium fluminis]MDC8756639.1 carbohydrate porin [Janthinobacterium fluminis]
MRISFALKPLAAAALLCAASGAGAASHGARELQQLVAKLGERMERLEQRNAELERELRASRAAAPAAPAPAAIEQRVTALESQQARTAAGLDSDRLSENEPELTSRLKAVEMQAEGARGAARKIEALEGLSAGFSLTTMAQKPFGAAAANSQLNYRGDAFITMPLGKLGAIEQRVFAQFRVGQGAGLNDMASFAKPNASAFRVLGGLRPDDSVAVLAQAWYQASIPLPLGGHAPRSKETLELGFGKMDPFAFFDQNAAAGDETRQFTNTVFVHNPLLDAGGDIGVDANGFAPGFRLSYQNASAKPESWRVSLGVFGAGATGSNYQRSLSSPLMLLQAETQRRLFGGLPGNYRVYAWRNSQASHFDESVTEPERHVGWGASLDQRVGDGVTLFGRYGRQLRGHVRFDQALTLGAEFGGSYWGRAGDSVGMAAGWLNTSRDYRGASAAAGAERVAELYYRYRINKQFELSPNLQYIGRPAGDNSVGAMKILGLRAQLSY